MTMVEDIEGKTTIAASELGHNILARLVEDRVFPEEMDAYRFAIGLGLALNKRTPLANRRTKFNLGSFDRDSSVASLIAALMPEGAGDPYRAAEELAETGFSTITQSVLAGEFRFSDIFEVAKKQSEHTGGRG
jgi:hypothetical protein